MARALDLAALLVLGGAVVAFALGIRALEREQDLAAMYWVAVGALTLRTATDLVRPSAGR